MGEFLTVDEMAALKRAPTGWFKDSVLADVCSWPDATCACLEVKGLLEKRINPVDLPLIMSGELTTWDPEYRLIRQCDNTESEGIDGRD